MIMDDGKSARQLVKEVRTIDTLILEDSQIFGTEIEPETWAKSVLFSDPDYAARLKGVNGQIRPVVVVTPDGQIKCITYDTTDNTATSFVILNLKVRPNNSVFHLSEVFEKIYDSYENRRLAKSPILVLTQSENAMISASTSPEYKKGPYVQISGVNFRYTENIYKGWQVVAQREFWKEFKLESLN